MLTPEQDLWTTNQFSLEFWFSQEIARSLLLVPNCADADLVYVPLKLIWAACNDDVRETISIFMAHLNIFLPLLDRKPHFMTLSRVADYNGVDMQQLLDSRIMILTIEGRNQPLDLVIEVPYPAHYHHHDGLRRNRFLHRASTEKSLLAFEAFAIDTHHGPELPLREALLQACLDSSQCQHEFPDNTGEAMNRAAVDLYHNASNAWFCMQPVGHSPTRRSTFDCLLAGSIPVFFSEDSVAHFPFAHSVDPNELFLLVSQDDVAELFSSILPNIPEDTRRDKLETIAKYAHLFQYSLTPHTGLIKWDNVKQIDAWDDALTFSLKTLILRTIDQGWLQHMDLS